MKDNIFNLITQYSIDVTGGDIPPENFEDLAGEIARLVEGDDYKYEYKRIIEYLNAKCKTKYRDTVSKTRQHIRARYKEGFKTEDFLKVIDNMLYWWKDKQVVHNGRTYNMNDYLRPQTLFGTKFEIYLLKNVPLTTNKPAEIE